MHTCIWSLTWCKKYKPYNSSTPLQRFLTFSFTSQRERKAVENGRTYYGAMEQICVCILLFCIVRKTGPILLQLMGLIVGRQANEIWVGLEIFKILYRLNYLGVFCLILLQCYYNCISVGFCQVKPILRCVLKCKNLVAIFSCRSILLGTRVPNDIALTVSISFRTIKYLLLW